MSTFTADLKVLKGDLLFIKRAAGFRRGFHPALNLLAVAVEDGYATTRFYNYEVAVTVSMPAVGDSTSFAVDMTALVDAVKAVGAKDIGTFTVNGDTLTVSADGVAVTVPLAGAGLREDMPARPVVDGGPMIAMAGAEFARIGSVTATSVGQDDTLPVLTGVRVECSGNEVVAVTTDRFKLAVVEATNQIAAADAFVLLIPGRPFHHFAKRADKSSEASVTVGANGMVSLVSDTCTVVVEQLDYDFPKWRGLLPSEFKASFVFDSSALLRAVKALPKGASTINLHIEWGAVEVVGYNGRDESPFSSMSLDVTEAECDYGMVIKFSAERVAAILNSIPKGVKVRYSGTTPTRPAVFAWDGARVLLMPIRIPQ
ncbi:DNA polymerase III subunit beta [Nocardia ninae]|uniref:DNA polymerase III subunit beta n=1 Tax=Nocardia ninae NBRC 108245 TaxID=1210091 RepID=A0A511MB50_9NOCA|nr:DNA polymerase III subunit beta [Nocardia ninae]GEM37417.1 DNA polymerase III subunit beta [Nocardia ninae NBRC 108245]